MNRPMRPYSLNVIELFLMDLLIAESWACALIAVAAFVWPGLLQASGRTGGLLVAELFSAAVLLLAASAGPRQNRVAMDLAGLFLLVAAVGWVGTGLMTHLGHRLIAGIIFGLGWLLTNAVRRQAVQARFKPRFFSHRAFETLIQVADVMLDGNRREVLHPIEVAINTDHVMKEIDPRHAKDIRTALFVLEWAAPLLIWRPLPFSDLGTESRRRLVEKLIGARGMFRGVASCLKMLVCVGYYGSAAGMRSTGYRPFEESAGFRRPTPTPANHPRPVEPSLS